MKSVQVAKTETIAFYKREDFVSFIKDISHNNSVVGLDVSVEDIEMEDPRRKEDFRIYTVTVFYDMSKQKE